MAVRGNKGFGDLVAGDGRSSSARLPPRTGVLGARENRLAELAAGSSVSRIQELIDPARCRIWSGHNRDYASLSEDSCRDLLDSLRAQGRQEVPAIVRRLSGDPEHEFEVICGARRHWSIAWLRAHDYRDFRFLIEPRDLTDEEAFRVADLENRSRKDLSDFERASDYARAVDRYYGGNQGRMAERLKVTRTWLSRYLELARLPAEVVEAFGSSNALGISHAARLAPMLRVPASAEPVMNAASTLAAEQRERTAAGMPALPPSNVMQRLTATRRPRPRLLRIAEHRDEQNGVVARAERGRGGAVTIVLPKPDLRGRQELLQAVSSVLDRLSER